MHSHLLSRDQKPEILEQFKTLDDTFLQIYRNKVMQEIIGASFDLSIETLESEGDFNVVRQMKREWYQMWEKCLGHLVAEPFIL